MRKMLVGSLLLAVSLFFASTGRAAAAPFEQLFRVLNVDGTCSVMAPGVSEFEDAVSGKAYPYGTRLKTGRKSSCVIEFSEGNRCRVLANTVLTITENAQDPKLKSIQLDSGKVEVSLEEEFHKNNGFQVETIAAICGAIGCEFSMEALREQDLNTVVIVCLKDKIRVFGPHYEIPEIVGEGSLSVSSSADRSFIRIKDTKGDYKIHYKDSEGQSRTADLKLGSIVKIWMKKSFDESLVITILIVLPDGTLEEAVTYTEKIEEETGATTTTQPGDVTTSTGPDASTTTTQRRRQGRPAWPNWPTTTWPTVTTTTKPSPTPPGSF